MTTERDIRNQIQFARDKGLEEGMEKMIESMRKNGIPEELIAKVKAECKKP